MFSISILSALIMYNLTNAELVIPRRHSMDKKSGLSKAYTLTSSISHLLTRAPDLGRVACGYRYGDSDSPIIMSTDSTCTTAYTIGIWGSCTYSSDIPVCSLHGACVDQAGCSDACSPNADINDNVITNTLSCSADYCQSYLLSDPASPSLGTQTSYTCNSTSQVAPVLVFVSPLETPISVVASTTSSSDSLATTSMNLPQSTPSPVALSTSNSSLTSSSSPTSNAPQATITVSSNQQNSSPDSHTGAIVGGSLGGIISIAILSFAIWLLRRHRKSRNKIPTAEPGSSSNGAKYPSDHVHELMEKSGNTPEIGGEMVMAEMESPKIGEDIVIAEMESPKLERPPVEMEA